MQLTRTVHLPKAFKHVANKQLLISLHEDLLLIVTKISIALKTMFMRLKFGLCCFCTSHCFYHTSAN